MNQIPELTPKARRLITDLQKARARLDAVFRRIDRNPGRQQDPGLAAEFERCQRAVWAATDALTAIGFTPEHTNHYLRKGIR